MKVWICTEVLDMCNIKSVGVQKNHEVHTVSYESSFVPSLEIHVWGQEFQLPYLSWL